MWPCEPQAVAGLGPRRPRRVCGCGRASRAAAAEARRGAPRGESVDVVGRAAGGGGGGAGGAGGGGGWGGGERRAVGGWGPGGRRGVWGCGRASRRPSRGWGPAGRGESVDLVVRAAGRRGAAVRAAGAGEA